MRTRHKCADVRDDANVRALRTARTGGIPPPVREPAPPAAGAATRRTRPAPVARPCARRTRNMPLTMAGRSP